MRLKPKSIRKYLDSVRTCCIELLSLNVGIKNVEPVIISVLKHIASLEIKKLPYLTTLTWMFSEMIGLACQHLSDELQKGDTVVWKIFFRIYFIVKYFQVNNFCGLSIPTKIF